ncbi:MAG: 7TM domain-containing protein [bacterium]
MKSLKSKTVSVDACGNLREARPASVAERRLLGSLFLIPGFIVLIKLLPFASLAVVSDMFTLTALPAIVANHVQRLMLMSLGAILVVVFRVTLGLRVLGPVRPILIALAYQITGFMVGTIFLVSVMVIIAMIRPMLKSAGIPYFARIASVLSLVSLMVLIAVKLSTTVGAEQFLSIGLLPVVVLTFAAEGFAKTLYREGLKSACWRAAMTIIAAALIKGLADIPGLSEFILCFPEMLLLQVGVIYLISRFLNFRALHFLNPKPPKSKRRTRAAKVRKKVKKKLRKLTPASHSLE